MARPARLGVTDHLGHQVEVIDLGEVLGDGPELLVGGDLFQMRLGELIWVPVIVGVRAGQQLPAVAGDDLANDDGVVVAALLPLDRQLVAPFIFPVAQINHDGEFALVVVSGEQATCP